MTEAKMNIDATEDRRSGKICTTSHGKEITWKGHLCEGANLALATDDNFCLWTRCGKHDVPAGKAHEGDIKEVDCQICLGIWNGENGQFGVGS